MPVTYDSIDLDKRGVYYTGTVTLVSGQPLCFVAYDNASLKGYGNEVEIPTSANQGNFAGIVHDESVGLTGPCYISMIVPRPGDVVEVLVSNGAAVTVGELLKLNYNVPTATAYGAFDSVTFATATATATVTGNLAAAAGTRYALAGLTAASSATAARVKIPVQFL